MRCVAFIIVPLYKWSPRIANKGLAETTYSPAIPLKSG